MVEAISGIRNDQIDRSIIGEQTFEIAQICYYTWHVLNIVTRENAVEPLFDYRIIVVGNYISRLDDLVFVDMQMVRIIFYQSRFIEYVDGMIVFRRVIQ